MRLLPRERLLLNLFFLLFSFLLLGLATLLLLLLTFLALAPLRGDNRITQVFCSTQQTIKTQTFQTKHPLQRVAPASARSVCSRRFSRLVERCHHSPGISTNSITDS